MVLIQALARLGRGDIRCVILGSDQGRESYSAELEDAFMPDAGKLTRSIKDLVAY